MPFEHKNYAVISQNTIEPTAWQCLYHLHHRYRIFLFLFPSNQNVSLPDEQTNDREPHFLFAKLVNRMMARSSVLRDYTSTSILMTTTHPNMRYQSHWSVLIAVVETLLPFLNWSALFCGILISAQYLYWAAHPIDPNPMEIINNVQFQFERQFIPNVGNAVMATSYALLCYLAHNDLTSSIPIMKWIASQHNHLMGWSSTQVFIQSIHSSQEHLYTVYNMDCTSGVATGEWVGPDLPTYVQTPLDICAKPLTSFFLYRGGCTVYVYSDFFTARHGKKLFRV